MSDTITREDALAHFGVKGMKWGVRKAQTARGGRYALKDDATERKLVEGTPPAKRSLSPGQKKALKIGGATVAVAGAAATAYVLKKNGNVKTAAILKQASESAYKDRMQKARYEAMSNRSKAGLDLNNKARTMNDTYVKTRANGESYVTSFGQEQWKTRVNTLVKDMQSESKATELNTRRILNQMPAKVTDERQRKLIGL